LRAKLFGAVHGHCRADALNAREVARGRHDAPLATANDNRFVSDAGVITLFNRSVEGVTVNVRQR
jgi:hypothetical protein